MAKTKEVAVIEFEKFDIAQLPELNGKKEEIKGIIEANPIVKIVDNSTYELAKKSRTAVKTLRTSLEKEQKDVKKKIKEYVLDVVDAEYDTLVLGVKSAEQIRQEPITAWEDKKEQERLEKMRLEELRVKQIKEAIQTFRNEWDDTISMLTFERIVNCKEYFEKTVSEFDRSKLAEFEVLFDDSVLYLTNLLNSKIKTLTEQEEIRLEQIRLAEERKKQEEEAKKIAEAQRLEREKFEAEQKAIAEKQRIAQEKFQKEKAEFEAKQAEVKFQERKKYLIELGMSDDGKERLVFEDIEFRYSQIKEFSEDNWHESIEYVGQKIAEFNQPKQEVKPDEIAQEQIRIHDEEDVHEVATAKPIHKEEKILNENPDFVNWGNIDAIWRKYYTQTHSLIEYLEEFYNVPTKKQ